MCHVVASTQTCVFWTLSGNCIVVSTRYTIYIITFFSLTDKLFARAVAVLELFFYVTAPFSSQLMLLVATTVHLIMDRFDVKDCQKLTVSSDSLHVAVVNVVARGWFKCQVEGLMPCKSQAVCCAAATRVHLAVNATLVLSV
jgi:hypothetical protein